MIAQTKWTSRTFSFESPAGLYPIFLERLRGAPIRAAMIANACPPLKLTVRPSKKLWSVQEQIGHLLQVDNLHQKRFDEFIAGVETLSPADMTNLATEQSSFNDQLLDKLLAAFKSERQHFVDLLAEADEDLIVRSALHPRLKKPIRLIDMVFFAAEHDDHHLALARNIINSK